MTFRIRGLVWVEIRPNEFRADVVGGHYLLFRDGRGMWILELYLASPYGGADRQFSWMSATAEHSKECAERDWRARITPALEPVEPDAELVEALEIFMPIRMAGESDPECLDDERVAPRTKILTWGQIRRIRALLARRGKGKGGEGGE